MPYSQLKKLATLLLVEESPLMRQRVPVLQDQCDSIQVEKSLRWPYHWQGM